jgi:hypothetical protein
MTGSTDSRTVTKSRSALVGGDGAATARAPMMLEGRTVDLSVVSTVGALEGRASQKRVRSTVG